MKKLHDMIKDRKDGKVPIRGGTYTVALAANYIAIHHKRGQMIPGHIRYEVLKVVSEFATYSAYYQAEGFVSWVLEWRDKGE